MWKKTSLAILSLAASSFAIAGTMSSSPALCTPMDVTVPCLAKGWNIGAQGLYFKPVFSVERGFETNLDGDYEKAEGKWGWGYRIEGSYHFSTGNDLRMNWLHYDISTNYNSYLGLTRYSVTPIPYVLLLKTQFDQVNLILGQKVNAGDHSAIRFFGGLQYAKIQIDARNQYLKVPPILRSRAVTNLAQFGDNDLNGVGPAFGVDYVYNLPSGFSIAAGVATSMVYGSKRFTEGYVLGPNNVVTFANTYRKQTIVPSLEGKLGVNYSYSFARGILNLEAGFETINYFDALERRGSAGFPTEASYTNFGLFGPYVGGKWVGNL